MTACGVVKKCGGLRKKFFANHWASQTFVDYVGDAFVVCSIVVH